MSDTLFPDAEFRKPWPKRTAPVFQRSWLYTMHPVRVISGHVEVGDAIDAGRFSFEGLCDSFVGSADERGTTIVKFGHPDLPERYAIDDNALLIVKALTDIRALFMEYWRADGQAQHNFYCVQRKVLD